ncbi:hypothetical protein QR680_005234 [Steinernema hermaphroditum]|uniref:Transcription initiation factor IIB n=1 Tax=Steinernema hermaphroditum TaxID=289476 RepID=A0AA39LUZ0_9BILA|nr:hypothetical protein QR680_005234 [Steinernema hermaphroditum]
MAVNKQERIGRWYFGGLASAGAACCTHPLDLLKVHLQTQQTPSVGLGDMAKKIMKNDGIRGFYNGLSASLLRQLTYSTTRFGMYETLKKQFPSDQPLPFYQKALLAGVSGACGGFVGTPGDLVNVRMQNDIKLPKDQRRNYKHAVDGVFRIVKEEGVPRLFGGATMATSRAVLMTIGQLAFYDQIKQVAMATAPGVFQDNPFTHFFSSISAASIATLMTQPLDVMKTRMMNAPPGTFKGIGDCFVYTAKLGPAGFFKGFFPAWVRLAPHTVLTFIFFEQLRMNFGYFKMTTLQCQYHPNAHLVEDHRAGDVICPECGLVVGDRLVDVGTEWRSFSNEKSGGNDPSRVGAPENPLLGSADLSTSIAVGFGGSEGDQSLANAQRKNMNNTDRQMSQAMSVIREMSERIHLARSIQDMAAKIFKDVLDSKALKGKNNEAQAAACLYIACRKEGVPRTFKEICAVSRSRFCGNLGLPHDIQLAATKIAKKAVELDLVAGRSPISIAAAAIYMATLAASADNKKSAKEIGEIAGAAEVTVKQTYKLLYPRAKDLFPEDFNFRTPIEMLPSS